MKCYHVDAFAEKLFEGNPAAVCVLDEWPSDALMQSIAVENNLSETAFTVREGERWRLRWFTPGGEIDLCGHATLGTAFVLANFVEPECERFVFDTMSGELTVTRKGDMYELDFPVYEMHPTEVTAAMERPSASRSRPHGWRATWSASLRAPPMWQRPKSTRRWLRSSTGCCCT